jgi:hypothetical protein
MSYIRSLFAACLCVCVIAVPGSAQVTAEEEEALAKASQNPVADLISLPLQNNTTFEWGPEGGTYNVLNIQPVLPFKLSEGVNLITRTILPVVTQPGLAAGEGSTTGLGDLSFTAFFSPRKAAKVTWGVGPVVLIPTATSDRLGTDKWGAGPSAVVLAMPGSWVVGALASQVWSFAGSGASDVSSFLLQPFANFNLSDGWYLVSAPILTANWKAGDGNKWTVPMGAGVGKIFAIGRRPINTSAHVYYDVVRPDFVGRWSTRLQFQLLFPKG